MRYIFLQTIFCVFMISCKTNNTISIIKEFNSLEYYDGKKTSTNFLLGKSYWLGASSYIDFSTANIKFINENDTVSLDFFPVETKEFRIRKYLSTFQPNKNRGFYKEDLFQLSEKLKLPKPSLNDNIYRIEKKHSYDLVYQEYKGKHYFMIYSITGGRMPEGVIVYKVCEVILDKEFKEKYFKKNKTIAYNGYN